MNPLAVSPGHEMQVSVARDKMAFSIGKESTIRAKWGLTTLDPRKPGATQHLQQHTMDETSLQSVSDKLREYPALRLAIVFGSMAAGSEGAESDLDIAVLADKPLNADTRMQIITDLSMLTGRPIDLVDLQTAGVPLLGEILTKGKRLFGSDGDYGMLISRHLFDTADFLPYRQRILEERRKAWIGI